MIKIFRWIFWVWLARPCSFLSPYWQGKLNAFIAFLAYYALGKRRAIVGIEFKRAFKDAFSKREIDHFIRSSFKVYINNQAKMLYIPKMDAANIEKFISVSGLEILVEELMKNKGIILLNPHFGPFLLVMAALGHRGFRLNQLAIIGDPLNRKRKGLDQEIYKAKFNTIEENLPANFINAADNRYALRRALSALKHNEIVIFASTGRAGRSWHQLPFLNRNAHFNLTPFKMSIKTGASLIPVFAVDTNPSPIAEIVIEKPIPVFENDSSRQLMARYIRLLEQYVTGRPDHFASFLFEMHVNAGWDDHPFFDDYATSDVGSQKT